MSETTTQETQRGPMCPTCGEPATHAMPDTGSGRRQLWCANAHGWFVSVSALQARP